MCELVAEGRGWESYWGERERDVRTRMVRAGNRRRGGRGRLTRLVGGDLRGPRLPLAQLQVEVEVV